MAGPKTRATAEPDIWKQPDGSVMSCEESILVLRENLSEIAEICQEALEDAVLMDVSEAQFREVLHSLVDSLANPYRKGWPQVRSPRCALSKSARNSVTSRGRSSVALDQFKITGQFPVAHMFAGLPDFPVA